MGRLERAVWVALLVFALVGLCSILSGAQVRISWTDNSDNETGFRIERKASTGGWLAVAVTAADAQEYIDTVHDGETYQYRVVAFNAWGPAATPDSEPFTAGAAPAAPDGLVVSMPGHLVSLSTRMRYTNGSDPVIAAFVTEGGPLRVVIRGAGPSLAQFGVADALADPRIELIGGPSNDDWDGTQQTRDAFASVNLYQFADGSKDSALIVEVSPGRHDVHLLSADGSSGTALIEVYALP